ncbi:MAG TPA: dihydrolipoyllysine-residue acetyltransferase [Burkholderiales bacterium]|nr:dihydrolipoyllysine-residue acetyltransferase [Burkholderiales bacterium]
MGVREVVVPDIGDFKDVPVIEILVKAGDTVKAEDSLITVESDKSTMEIPSPAGGVIKELKIKIGDVVNTGSLIAIMEEGAADAAPAAAAAPAKAAAPAAAPAPAPAAAAPAAAPQGFQAAATEESPPPATATAPHPLAQAPSGDKPHASPSVRKFARELGVDLSRVSGSGPKSRVLHEDVQNFVKQALQGGDAAAPGAAVAAGGGLNLLPWPKVDFSKFGETESVPLSRIKKISGANLHRNWVMIPHVTQNEEADVTELEEFRKSTNESIAKSGVKLTMLAFIIKASIAALKKYPDFNSSLEGDNLVLKKYYNIGFAADTPNGLVVPVIKGADKKGVIELAHDLGDLSAQAREGKLKPADMQGASFTISSLGGIGGTSFTPIINAPEVAILGVAKGQIKPVWDGKQFAPRLMLPLCLSYDHRVIDGAAGARFAVHLALLLSDMRRTLL